MSLKSSSNQLQSGSNARRTSDSELDHRKLLLPSPGHLSMNNFEADSIRKTSYNMAASPQQSFQSAHRRQPTQRQELATPTCNLWGQWSTTQKDVTNNFESETGNFQISKETEKIKRHVDSRLTQRNSPYPLWKFNKSREPTETALEVAYRTILDYKQPVTLHRQPKADRRMGHYDFLPSIKIPSEEDQQRREVMRYQLKEQLQLEEERKQQEMLEMEQDFILDGEREENLQKNIFLPSGEEYEFSEGDISMATLPIPSPKGECRISMSSHHSAISTDKPSSSRPVSPRHSSHDIGQASNKTLTFSASPPSPSHSTRGSKRRYSVGTLVRREKMFSMVSHWPEMRPSPKLYEIDEPLNSTSGEDIIDEKPKQPPPPPVHHAHHRRRNLRMPSHAESKIVQKRAHSFTK